MEVLLVLAVLILFLGIAWPSLAQLSAEQRLRQASADVQQQLGIARTRALEDGHSYRFHYEPGGRWFALLPADIEPGTLGEAGSTPGGSTTAPSAAPPGPTGPGTVANGTSDSDFGFRPPARHLGQLPEGVVFSVATMAPPPTQTLTPDLLAGLPRAEEVTYGVAWSLPITFALDGTSTGGDLTLADTRGFELRLSVRPLTGAITPSPVTLQSQN